MDEQDEEWILDWIENARTKKHENPSSMEEEMFNNGIDAAIDLFNETFYHWNKDQEQKAEQEIAELEERLEDMEDSEEKKEMVEDLEESKQILQRVKKKRENFLKPLYEDEE